MAQDLLNHNNDILPAIQYFVCTFPWFMTRIFTTLFQAARLHDYDHAVDYEYSKYTFMLLYFMGVVVLLGGIATHCGLFTNLFFPLPPSTTSHQANLSLPKTL